MRTLYGRITQRLVVEGDVRVFGSIAHGASVLPGSYLLVEGDFAGPLDVDVGGVMHVSGVYRGRVTSLRGDLILSGVAACPLQLDGRVFAAPGTVFRSSEVASAREPDRILSGDGLLTSQMSADVLWYRSGGVSLPDVVFRIHAKGRFEPCSPPRPTRNREVEPVLDIALEAVVASLTGWDEDGARIARVMRETFDQLYDGGRTGRYRWDQLYKTEKTHFGTLVEINLQREFAFADGVKLDYLIAGYEVDAKYSQDIWRWMLPPEAVGELCLVITASDRTSLFSAGVIRATPARLNAGSNRDAKKTLNMLGRSAVTWIHRDTPMPPNVLLQLPDADVDRIFAQRSGQQKVNELFRRAVGQRVSRAAVETVAMQQDPMKRVRANGGARQHLAPEGIAILGGDYRWQRDAARELGLSIPGDGEFVSCYLIEAPQSDTVRVTQVGDRKWRVASPSEASPVPLTFYANGPG